MARSLMARAGGPTVAAATKSWAMLETALATADGPRLWDEHWRIVRALRRTYVLAVVGIAAVIGAVAGLGAWSISVSWPDDPLILPILLGSGPLVFGYGLRQFIAATVAPFVPKPRHLWARWISVGLYEAVVLSGPVLPWSLWAAGLGAVCVALPLWAAAFVEARQPVPSFPAEWRQSRAG